MPVGRIKAPASSGRTWHNTKLSLHLKDFLDEILRLGWDMVLRIKVFHHIQYVIQLFEIKMSD